MGPLIKLYQKCKEGDIMKGVTIADGCVIAANSVVTKSMAEENALIAGNSAKIIKKDILWEI